MPNETHVYAPSLWGLALRIWRRRAGIHMRKREGRGGAFFVDPGSAFAPLELGENVRGLRTVPREQHHAVEPKIRSFAYEVQFITVLRGEEHLGAFLGDLLQDRVLAFCGKACDIRAPRLGLESRGYRRAEAVENVTVAHCVWYVP